MQNYCNIEKCKVSEDILYLIVTTQYIFIINQHHSSTNINSHSPTYGNHHSCFAIFCRDKVLLFLVLLLIRSNQVKLNIWLNDWSLNTVNHSYLMCRHLLSILINSCELYKNSLCKFSKLYLNTVWAKKKFNNNVKLNSIANPRNLE